MKKYSLILWTALTMTSTFTACTENDNPMGGQTEAKPVTIHATIDGNLGSRVALEDDAENQVVKVDWKQGDKFKINVDGTDYTFTYTENNKFECSDANFPETFSNTGNVTATYPAVTPREYTNQPGTLEGAAALLTMTATLDVESGQSTENLNLNFKHNNSIVKMTLGNEAFKEKDVTWVTLKSGDTAVAVATGTFASDANGNIVAYFAVGPQAVANISILAVCEYKNYTAALTDNTLGLGKLYNVSKTMTEAASMGNKTAVQAVKGDLVMADGTFISKDEVGSLTDEQKANVRGVVFWTTADSNTSGNTPAKLTDDKIMAKDFPNCKHGLIVSLKDVAQTKWQKSFTKIADWQTETFEADDKENYKSIASTWNSADFKNDLMNYILGYQNTEVLKAYNESLSDDESAKVVLPVSLLENFSTDNPAPANTTGWFIPSMKELTLLYGFDADNVYIETYKEGSVTKTLVNGILTNWNGNVNVLADNYYWSSSEFAGSAQGEIRVNFDQGNMNGGSKTQLGYVRAVCAF